MSWDLTGKRVLGKYLGDQEVVGTVEHSRVALGGRINHYVNLDAAIEVYGAVRDRIILEEPELIRILEA